MRAFIALDLDEQLKEELYGIQKLLKDNSKRGSWVPQSNFHITLKFLGNIREEEAKRIDEVIKGIAIETTPISLTLDNLGYFNHVNGEYRVLWLGVRGELDQLFRLYDIMEREMKKIGYPMERRKFTPHITLGRRIRTSYSFDKLEELIHYKLGRDFLLDNISLMKSEEIMRKRVYTPIKIHKFKGE